MSKIKEWFNRSYSDASMFDHLIISAAGWFAAVAVWALIVRIFWGN